jgi:hypothetical protein
MTCNGDLLGSGGFQDVVMEGCLQVTVSSRIDPFPHGTRACGLHIRGSIVTVHIVPQNLLAYLVWYSKQTRYTNLATHLPIT